ncbi:MAG: ClpXP protease specificity-enhancing factor SspB [Alphaproteobacteria bacterium]
METQAFPYNQWYNDALNEVLKKAIGKVAQEGFSGEHHFYITFRTDDTSTDIPDHLRAKWPEEMTIALQHEFWDLRVDDTLFAVTLAFNGVHERLRIPWRNVVAFVDPSVKFVIQLNDLDVLEEAKEDTKKINKKEKKPSKDSSADSKVVSLSSFRKKDK